MRDLYRSLALLETRLSETYGLSLNEAMVLCSIGEETVMAGVVVERTGLTASHASKMIRSVEEKGLLVRTLGEKRQAPDVFCPDCGGSGSSDVWRHESV